MVSHFVGFFIYQAGQGEPGNTRGKPYKYISQALRLKKEVAVDLRGVVHLRSFVA